MTCQLRHVDIYQDCLCRSRSKSARNLADPLLTLFCRRHSTCCQVLCSCSYFWRIASISFSSSQICAEGAGPAEALSTLELLPIHFLHLSAVGRNGVAC